MTNKISTLLLLIFAFTQMCFSQKTLEKAEKYYALQDFKEAIIHYNTLLDQNPDDLRFNLGLARSYAKSNDYKNAINYFALAGSISSLDKSDLLLYAHTLRKTANYNEARLEYEKVKMFDTSLAQHYLLSCDYAEHLLSSGNDYSIKAFQHNTEDSEYAIRSKGKTMYWMVAKDEEDRLCPTSLEMVGDIMNTFRSDDIIPNPVNSDCFIMTDYAFNGAFSAVMQSETMISSPLVLNKLNSYLKLVSENGGNNYEENFPYNGLGFSVAFPQLTNDGTRLFFSSDMPGGFGGFDLYMSEKINGKWSSPKNLGAVINSIGDEITPYFDGSTMFFASNYLHGLGGFDIFKSESYNGKYTFPSNLGNGVNSPQDDAFPYSQKESAMLYFSSNRLGSQGGLDIYSAYKPNEFPVTYLNVAQDAESFAANSESGNSRGVSLSKFDEQNEMYPKVVQVNSEWEGAMMTSFDEALWNDTPVYFIQLAAMSAKNPNSKNYAGLAKYGNIYTMHASNITKIRLGYFFSESEARAVLSSVKESGYTDAFITKQPLKTNELELLVSNSDYEADSYMVPKRFKGTSGYKVRLASYENPKWFNINRAKDIGKIEQWSKGGWTIFVLSGFNSQEEASKARVRAVNKGFEDAQVVFDNNGLLEKVKSN